MNIFYFNITYTCNSSCVFCYSHNTIHSGKEFNELSLEDFTVYLRKKEVCCSDRVIINGGEPFLHSKIIEILKLLHNIGCEVLIYTNGRCLKEYKLNFVTNKFRFIIPIHGYKSLHDKITRSLGSFDATLDGMKHLSLYNSKLDVKVILNPQMIKSQIEFDRTLKELDSMPFNNAIHITKMADTIISHKNKIPSVSNKLAAKYTKLLYKHFIDKGVTIKIFDTCIKDIDIKNFNDKDIPLSVFFKDTKAERDFKLYSPKDECRKNCSHKLFCQSAVSNYTVLEYNGGFYKSIE